MSVNMSLDQEHGLEEVFSTAPEQRCSARPPISMSANMPFRLITLSCLLLFSWSSTAVESRRLASEPALPNEPDIRASGSVAPGYMILTLPNQITRANAGGSRQLAVRTPWAARVAQFAH